MRLYHRRVASVLKPPPPSLPLVTTGPDERAARRDSRGGPRVLSLSELERLRDDLAERLHGVRRTLSDRTWVEEQNRRLIEEMMLEPEKHKWVRVGAEDIGERGCKHWHVRPRWGILGMMLNWWRVRISSGCPLAT